MNKIENNWKDVRINCITKYTPLPADIANLIVSEYLYTKHSIQSITALITLKIKINHQNSLLLIRIYYIISFLIYILCFIIITWEHYIFTSQQNEYSSSIWKSFQIYIFSIFCAHPIFKIINYSIICHVSWNDKYFKDNARFLLFMIPWIGIFCCCVLPALFPIIIPAVLLYSPVIILVGFIATTTFWICYKYIFKAKLMEFNVAKLTYKNKLAEITFIVWAFCGIYIQFFVVITSIMCIYDGTNKTGWWYNCLYYTLSSGYCPDITIDFTNWKACALFISWILF